MTRASAHLVTFTCPCVGCKYDLMGLDAGGRCPECGTRIKRSYSGSTLDDADPAWLATISRGQTRIARACTIGLFGACLAIVSIIGLLITLRLGGLNEWRWPVRIASVVSGTPLLIAFALLVSGAWNVTTQEPDAEPGLERAACRRMTVALLAIGLVVGALGLLAPLSLARTPIAVGAVDVLLLLGLSLLCLLALVGSQHLARLAIRLPDAPLGARLVKSSRLAVAFIVLCGLAAAPSVVHPELDYLTMPGTAYGVLYLVLIAATLVAIGVYARQARVLARALRGVGTMPTL